ncbi:MAG TPA: hypothetical protein VND93_21680, partial [Myxococcales bacterium]|nr:hypothetical protein [Myxococcales bacterium]
PLVSILEDALPDPLYGRLARAVRRVGSENLTRTYQTTFWFPLRQPPSSVVEEAALHLRALLPRAALACP